MENIKEFIDLICPEHGRTSCSDDNISNGFYLEEDGETISQKYYHRCVRCALLEIENGTIKRTDANNKIIPERLSFSTHVAMEHNVFGFAMVGFQSTNVQPTTKLK